MYQTTVSIVLSNHHFLANFVSIKHLTAQGHGMAQVAWSFSEILSNSFLLYQTASGYVKKFYIFNRVYCGTNDQVLYLLAFVVQVKSCLTRPIMSV